LASLSALILFSSCSKFGRLPASEKGFTNVAFSSGHPRNVRLVGPPQDGGVVIWGVSADGERAFSLILENDSALAKKDKIPNGEWNFYAVGWTDATNNFEGTARCATATANLQGSSTTIALNLTPASCTSPAFGAAGFFSGGSPKPLRFIRCNALPGSVDGTQNCDGASTVGDFNSFKVTLVEHELGTLGTQAAAPAQLESRCFNPGYSGSASVGDSSILLPVGAASGSPLIYKVTGYTDTGCSAGASTFTFDRGLAASTVANTFVGPAASFSSVYLVQDNTQPTVSAVSSSTANGDYYLGESISIQVALSEAVTVAGGTPTLGLNTGGTATYASGSGTSTLNFTYTVGAGENNADLDYSSTSAISLNGATIKDAANNNLNSTLVSPGAAGSLGNNKNLIIHGLHLLSVVPAYSGFGNWMKYVRFTSTANPFYAQPTPTACDGSEAGPYGRPTGCIHAGELRKVVVTGRTSCANLTATDQNNVFEWKCDDFSGTQAKFFSVRFQPGKGLKHLVDATSWLGNKVTVLDGAVPIGESVNGTSWGWTNTVEALPASTGSVFTIDNTYQGKVLTVSSPQNAKGYKVDSAEIAIVTLSTNEVTYDEATNFNFATGSTCSTTSPATSVLFCVNGFAWGWYEIAMRGGTASNKVRTPLKFFNVNFSRVHLSTAHDLRTGEATTAFELIGSNRNLFSDVRAFKLGGMGAMTFATTSGQNRIERARFSDQVGIANSSFITINDGNSNLFHDLTISQLAQSTSTTITSGIRINTGQYNTISKTTISNIQDGPSPTSTAGIYLNTSAANNTLTQVTAFNIGDAGLVVNQADTNVVQYSTFTNNLFNGIYLSGTGTNGNFFRGLAIANTQKGIESASGITGSGNVLQDSASGHNTTFAVDLSIGTSLFSVLGYLAVQGTCGVGNTITNADCTHSSISPISVSLTSAWTGKVTSDDSQNGSDTGSAVAFSSITDWGNFTSGPRAWGRDGAPDSFPGTNLKGACVSGNNCRIWDWSLPGSGPLFNKSHNGTSTNSAFTTGACPVNGNDTESVQGGVTVLKHAIELVDDDVGNNDGLCESSEACVHTPHIGSYQGTGNYTAPCTFTGGTLTGITLVEHSTL